MSYERRPPAPFLQRQHIRTLLIFVVALAIVWWQNAKPVPQPPGRPDNETASNTNPEPSSRPGDQQIGTSDEAPSEREGRSTLPDDSEPTPAEVTPDREPNSLPKRKQTPDRSTTSPKEKAKPRSEYLVENQSIRDLNGHVAFKGTIDLGPTIERIERGEGNRHRNDGTTFQNREGRLPRKPSGYYKEYVHPTTGINGPGPQRIIIGKEGEIWYTPDHYNSFRQIHRKT